MEDKKKIRIRQLYLYGEKTTYAVNEIGVVYSLNYGHTKKMKRLSQVVDKNGYLKVGIHHNKKCTNIAVHRLVGMTFIPIPEKYLKNGLTVRDLQINHKDGNKKNNTISNLEWCTGKENVMHAELTGLRHHNNQGEKHPMTKLTNDQVVKICELLQEGNSSVNEIAKKFNVSNCIIHGIKNRCSWKEISKDYDFSLHKPQSRSIDCYLTRYTDEFVTDICIELMKGKLTMKEIAKKFNVSFGEIQHIKYGKIRKDITKKFVFTKRSGNYHH